MRNLRGIIALLSISILACSRSVAQSPVPFLSDLQAGPHFPLYTGYAAAMPRSQFTLDQGYRLQYDVDSLGVDFITDKAGNTGWAFCEKDHWIWRVKDMYRKPVISVSYPDMVKVHFYPFKDIRVEISMVVHSSTATFWQVEMTNESNNITSFRVASFISDLTGILKDISIKAGTGKACFSHIENPYSWTRDHHIPHVDSIRDLFQLTKGVNAVTTVNDPSFNGDIFLKKKISDSAHTIAFCKDWRLKPHESDSFRVFRIVQPNSSSSARVDNLTDSLKRVSIGSYERADEKLFSRTPPPPFKDTDAMGLYWSACNMMRQVFYPPEGECHYNYYVFSREPKWGWGHGGQVFHESLSMLAYAYIDPRGAMNSQRVFMERQHADGYINYRTGPYLDETIPYNGSLTSSAPWYAWTNWEIYKISKSKKFLQQMYISSEKLYNWFITHRDSDHDGLCEWGGHAVLESVRDDQVAVWDQVGWPSNFESLDLNCMLVMEARSLEKMANVLGLKTAAAKWQKDFRKRAALINKYCWDDKNGFYYNVDKKTHGFSYSETNDLKRDEIIGFLPLWAGVASKDQAARLVKKLTDTSEFWRPYGIPSLSAKDPYYNPKGYWNGPVWVEWNYLIERGLLNYGYKKEAKELVKRVAKGMIAVLRQNHELWEFYSPDEAWGGYHRTYIWAGLINRMMMDLQSGQNNKR